MGTNNRDDDAIVFTELVPMLACRNIRSAERIRAVVSMQLQASVRERHARVVRVAPEVGLCRGAIGRSHLRD
jgi:hypothetical protein